MEKNSKFLFLLILLFGFLLRVFLSLNNNFFFTMDQGNDAVHVREILSRHQILLNGPETGIAGLYAGPGWYYFISLGYLIFNGHPFGSVLMLILLNTTLVYLLMVYLQKRASLGLALMAGLALQVFWPFFDTSRYGFNPFPLVFLSVITLIFLNEVWSGRKNNYLLAGLMAGLAFHVEVAFAMVLAIYYFLSGFILILKKKIPLLNFATGIVIFASLFVFQLIAEIQSDFSMTSTFINEINSQSSVFAVNNLEKISRVFVGIIGSSVLPQWPLLGSLLFLIVAVVFVGQKFNAKNLWIKNFVFQVFALTIIAWFWFLSNRGWQAWQTVALPTLLYLAFIFMVWDWPKLGKILILTFLVSSQTVLFIANYKHYREPLNDPSLLKNELKAVDWVYQKADGQGFKVYDYLPSVNDYPYQYLIWWHGLKNYGYLPCEYASFPGSPGLVIPGKRYYAEPKKECPNFQFLIIEPDDKNKGLRENWISRLGEGTTLLEKESLGLIEVQKRQITR